MGLRYQISTRWLRWSVQSSIGCMRLHADIWCRLCWHFLPCAQMEFHSGAALHIYESILGDVSTWYKKCLLLWDWRKWIAINLRPWIPSRHTTSMWLKLLMRSKRLYSPKESTLMKQDSNSILWLERSENKNQHKCLVGAYYFARTIQNFTFFLSRWLVNLCVTGKKIERYTLYFLRYVELPSLIPTWDRPCGVYRGNVLILPRGLETHLVSWPEDVFSQSLLLELDCLEMLRWRGCSR